MKKTLLWGALVLSTAGGAQAVDGVLEINQTCAVSTGCFPGDEPGVPVTLTAAAGHSFRLTSDLTIDSGGDAIQVAIDDARIDLNGFTIRGTSSCDGQPAPCDPPGEGAGVSVTSTSLRGVVVSNGSVVGMGGDGIRLGIGATVSGVKSRRNGRRGVFVGGHAHVDDCDASDNSDSGVETGGWSRISATIAANNGRHGFELNAGTSARGVTATSNAVAGIWSSGRGLISDSTAERNGSTGIRAVGFYPGTQVRNNVVYFNEGSGIVVDDGGTISNNQVLRNGGDGVIAGDSSTIDGNAVFENGADADDDGIQCSLGCVIRGNAVRDNVGYGLRLQSSSSGYSDNAFSANGAGTVLRGTDAGGNVCGGSLGCP